ncbi:hypothetical protein V5799_009246, partial [Amblyomma americanum]
MPSTSNTDLGDSWQLLCDQGGAPSNVTLEDFVFSDACALTTEELDDETIIQSFADTGMEDDASDQDAHVASSAPTPT